MPSSGSPSNTRIDATLGISGRIRANSGGELGIDVHDRGVAVVDDVGRLVVGQPVVDRHRGGAELARAR